MRIISDESYERIPVVLFAARTLTLYLHEHLCHVAGRNQQAKANIELTEPDARIGSLTQQIRRLDGQIKVLDEGVMRQRGPARALAWIAFWDIVVFFGVLLVGFAYLWKRGDLDWVRSTMAEQLPETRPADLTLAAMEEKVLVGAGDGSVH